MMRKTIRSVVKATAAAALLGSVQMLVAIPAAQATYAVVIQTAEGVVQHADVAKSTLEIKGLTVHITSDTKFEGVPGLYALTPGMRVTIRYFSQPGARTAGTAVSVTAG